MFYKICKFESLIITNDVIMTSLPKTMENVDLLETKQIIYHSKCIDESYQKMYFLLNLSHYVKSYGGLCQILAFFMMPAPLIWPCHVTQEANLKKIVFLILHLILEKVTKYFRMADGLMTLVDEVNLKGFHFWQGRSWVWRQRVKTGIADL